MGYLISLGRGLLVAAAFVLLFVITPGLAVLVAIGVWLAIGAGGGGGDDRYTDVGGPFDVD